MNLLDMISTSVLGALGCNMDNFLRYFPAAETMYNIFVATAIGLILLNWVWQLFKCFGNIAGVEAEDPIKLSVRSVLFIFLVYFSDEILELILKIGGTPYDWILTSELPPLSFADFNSVIVAMLGVLIYTAPIAFATGSSQSTSNIFKSWCRMIGGQIFLLILIWFLCAIAFLKISQKIDSFMSSLGINVGHTGGSMLGELMIAMKGIKAFGGGGFGKSGGGSGGGSSGSAASASFLSGGLAGAVGRSFTRGATNTVTNQGGSYFSRKAYETSVSKGGDFANNVIGAIAKGSIKDTGTISGSRASEAMTSYFGFAGKTGAPSFRDVEIGGGHITGKVITTANPNPTEFAMYNADQYMAPDGKYTTETASDGSKWYKQTPQDTVEKTPYMDSSGKVKYNESIVQKLPQISKRKDRI